MRFGILFTIISVISAGAVSAGECTVVQERSGGAGSYSFDQFNPELGTLRGVSIEFASTLSARMDGRNDCTSCTGFKAILCGWIVTDWPGISENRINVLLCSPFSASRGQVVNVSLGGTPPVGGTYSVSSSHWPLYTGTGHIAVTSGSSLIDDVPCGIGGPCPQPPPPGFPPCQDFGDEQCFSRAYTITMSTVIRLTYRYESAVTIDSQPVDISACPLGTAGFMLQASGDGPLAYQWQTETTVGSNTWVDLADGPIPATGATATGAMTDSLAVSNVGADVAGRYRCSVSGPCNSITSDPATLTVCDTAFDFNCDGLVDLADLSVLLAHFGTAASATEGDGDGDGDVDLADLSGLLALWGVGCS